MPEGLRAKASQNLPFFPALLQGIPLLMSLRLPNLDFPWTNTPLIRFLLMQTANAPFLSALF